MVKLKLLVFMMMFFLLEKLNMRSVITRENIYQKSFGSILFKVILKMNLFNLIRLTKMAKQNEVALLCLIWPDLIRVRFT